MQLEEQLASLADLGLELADGITIDDMLYSFGRDDYEVRPFNLVLFVLGIEVERPPWGRSMCRRVWNFDPECIGSTGDYVRIVQRLAEVADATSRITDLSDLVDLDAGKAWLKYKVDGAERHWNIEVNDDWADTLSIAYVMGDIQSDGKRFFFKDNGQAMVLFYLDETTAAKLNELSGNALTPVLAE